MCYYRNLGYILNKTVDRIWGLFVAHAFPFTHALSLLFPIFWHNRLVASNRSREQTLHKTKRNLFKRATFDGLITLIRSFLLKFLNISQLKLKTLKHILCLLCLIWSSYKQNRTKYALKFSTSILNSITTYKLLPTLHYNLLLLVYFRVVVNKGQTNCFSWIVACVKNIRNSELRTTRWKLKKVSFSFFNFT